MKRGISVHSYVFVYILRIYYTAVPKSHSVLLFIEIDLLKRLYLLFLYRLIIQKPCNDASFQKMLNDYFLNILRLYAAVERAFGIYNDYRA